MTYRLTILFCSLFYCLQGQNFIDIVNFSYTNTPSNNFESSNAQTVVEELALELSYPIVVNEKTVLLTGFNVNRTSLKLDADAGITALNVLSLNFGINKIFSEKWSGTFMVFPKIASDKIILSKENLQLGVLALFSNTKNKNLKYKYGMFANTENYGVILVPILGLYYLSTNEKFEVNLNLPINADLNYRVWKKAVVGMRFDGLGTTYNLHQPIQNTNSVYVAKTSNELFSYLRFELTKSIYLNTKIGYALGRNYEVYDSNDKIDLAVSSFYFGDDRTQLNDNFKDGVVFKLEVLYQIHF